MRKAAIKTVRYLKGLTLLVKPHAWLGWTAKPMKLSANTLFLSRWIARQDKKTILNDFYTAKRDHSKRYKLYQDVLEKQQLENEPVYYLEFGVFGGSSFQWWMNHAKHPDNRFYGFDTFEGLPEDWGTYGKGEMSSGVPQIEDKRGAFIKGLFQDTLFDFLKQTPMDPSKRKIIHLDADLFSSTLFVLTSMAPYLKKGDILLFDEFNVPNHEFYAFKLFTESFYVKTRLLGAVNNFYQVALIIE